MLNGAPQANHVESMTAQATLAGYPGASQPRGTRHLTPRNALNSA
jgi:hypothetical protein